MENIFLAKQNNNINLIVFHFNDIIFRSPTVWSFRHPPVKQGLFGEKSNDIKIVNKLVTVKFFADLSQEDRVYTHKGINEPFYGCFIQFQTLLLCKIDKAVVSIVETNRNHFSFDVT